MKISFFLLSLAQNTCTAPEVFRCYTFYFTKKKLKLKRFSAILTKSKIVAFSLLFSLLLDKGDSVYILSKTNLII